VVVATAVTKNKVLPAVDVKWLQVEATTKCNAWCPGCGRNKGGYELADDLVITDLSIDRYQQILNEFPNLETVDFCGTYGDAIAAANIIELTELTKQHSNKIIVRTNGSLRTASWWQDYASLLKDHNHEVWFCLDGLKDTHSIYRQATDWDKIIANAQAFIQAGGQAVWQFIPWQHNEHQIKDCIRLSQQLGFARFELIRGVRKNFKPRNYQTGESIVLEPWALDKQMNKYEKVRTMVPVANCQHLTQPSYYVNANGELSNCCYMNTRLCKSTIEQLPNIGTELSVTPRSLCLHHCGN